MELKEIALEVARELSEEGFSGTGTDYTLAFYPRFLAAVDAERGKDAVGYIDSAQLKRWETLRGTDFEVAERCYIPWSAIPFKSDISDCSTPVFLSPTIPEGWKLLKDTTQEERSWPEDSSHENGKYYNLCCHCGRTFIGYKRRGLCKVCAELAAGVPK